MMNLINISLIRVLAILLVVVGHSVIIYSGNWYKTAIVESDFLLWIYRLVYSFHMPLFVFVSGYLYFYTVAEQRHNDSIIVFVKKKLSRLIIPYFSIAILWMIPIRVAIEYYSDLSLYNVFIKGVILGGDTGSLWFLLMLFNVFVLFCFFEKCIVFFNGKQRFYSGFYVYGAFLFSFIVHFFSLKHGLFDFKLPNVIQFRDALYYFIYFHVGYLYRMNIDCIHACIVENKFKNISFSLVTYAVGMFLLYYPSFLVKDGVIFELVKLVSALSAIQVVYSVVMLWLSISDVTIKSKLFMLLDKHSFSIYLFHAPIIYIIVFKLYDEHVYPFFVFILCFVASIIVSIFMSYLCGRFKLTRFFIGMGGSS